ncbi:hypothetical protein NDU88_006717 [Pleurodeles waltl]|uniref:Uncharacterized protein n=1 Tax=Pleurodeles waltl TaxID=8319 RepID=A0AAV7N9F6_PLEWA|nr:hypothetical protein NDU88_006717 [Pleurodeles waltl]
MQGHGGHPFFRVGGACAAHHRDWKPGRQHLGTAGRTAVPSRSALRGRLRLQRRRCSALVRSSSCGVAGQGGHRLPQLVHDGAVVPAAVQSRPLCLAHGAQ